MYKHETYDHLDYGVVALEHIQPFNLQARNEAQRGNSNRVRLAHYALIPTLSPGHSISLLQPIPPHQQKEVWPIETYMVS